MSRRAVALLVLVLGVAALVGPPARAQLELGGSVPSFLGLSIGAPGSFARLGGGAYELRVPVEITSTEDFARLSIADGQDLKGSARGHLRNGSRVVAAPLEAAVPGHAPQSLDGPTDPILQTWGHPLAAAPVTIALRQRLPGGSIASPALHKTLLITISSQTP